MLRLRWPGSLRPYQDRALAALAEAWAADRRRAWVVLPPGAGKTLVGLEAARRLGRRTVVFVPNTAIQSQWAAHWERFGGSPGTGRDLVHDVTVLTYQSLAVFEPDAETDEEGRGRGLVGLLHENGRKLIGALRAAGPLTVVLDECHHLLDVWGRLVAEVLEELPSAYVIGLTATPPESLTPDEARLVDTLFGEPILGASIPALVRQGHLPPFAELAWLTPPTAGESAYIAAEAERFAELTTGLIAPEFTSTGLLTWLDQRFDGRAAPWERLEKDRAGTADAVLRFCHAGLLRLPPGARLRERHQHPPCAEDWVELLDDYLRHFLLRSEDPRDEKAVHAIRGALPAVGYQLTRRGIRAARSPVDRVLARSAAKTHGAVEIAAAEAASLGDRLRCLILCDHERASATLPARLHDVLDAEAGSAWLMLQNLVADPRTRDLAPVLVTGRTVAAGAATAREFAARHPGLGLSVREDDGLALLEGGWSSRRWVPLVTAFFEAGACRALVGTRALLGEGWDARGVNVLVDLTTATTPTSVVQTRGRALRLDAAGAEKVSHTWSVVCLTDRHPKGAADWDRFVRKHRGYLAAAADGEIVSGVAHVHAAFSPYAPPPEERCDEVNAAMLARVEDRPGTRASWRIGDGFRDALVHTVRLRTPHMSAPEVTVPYETPEPPIRVPAPACAVPRPRHDLPSVVRRTATAGVAAGGAAGLFAGDPISVDALVRLPIGAFAALAAVVMLVPLLRRVLALRAARLLDPVTGEPSPARFAYAVADALHTAGLSRRGAEAVHLRTEPDGTLRLALSDVDTATSEVFATALDEVVSPIGAPRYVIPRYVVRPRPGAAGRHRALAWLRGRATADGAVHHAVPTVLGQRRALADAFAASWNRWISAGEAVYTSTPEGAGILATHRGEDPFAATTVLRLAWD